MLLLLRKGISHSCGHFDSRNRVPPGGTSLAWISPLQGWILSAYFVLDLNALVRHEVHRGLRLPVSRIVLSPHLLIP